MNLLKVSLQTSKKIRLVLSFVEVGVAISVLVSACFFSAAFIKHDLPTPFRYPALFLAVGYLLSVFLRNVNKGLKKAEKKAIKKAV